MPILDVDPGNSPESPGTLYFYKQGSPTNTGFTVTTEGVLSAPGGVTGPVTTTTLTATSLALTGATAATAVETTQVTGDSQPRLTVTADGTMKWGSGAGASDCTLDRYAAGGLELNCALRFTNGQLLFGAAGDVNLYWGAANSLKTDDALEIGGALTAHGYTVMESAQTNGNLTVFGPALVLGTIGGGLQIKEGANACAGTATLVGGTATVATTKVTANSHIFLTNQALGGTAGFLRVSARTAGTSFTITSSSGTDTSSVAWMIVEPAP